MQKMISILKPAVSKDPFRPGLNYVVFDGKNAIACNAMVYIEIPFVAESPVAVHPKTRTVYPLNGTKIITDTDQHVLPDFGTIKPMWHITDYATISTASRFDPKILEILVENFLKNRNNGK